MASNMLIHGWIRYDYYMNETHVHVIKSWNSLIFHKNVHLVKKYACPKIRMSKKYSTKKCMSKKICISLVVWHPGTDTSEAGIGSEHSLLAQHFGWLYALEAIPKRYFCISFKLEAFYEIPFGFNCRNEATKYGFDRFHLLEAVLQMIFKTASASPEKLLQQPF